MATSDRPLNATGSTWLRLWYDRRASRETDAVVWLALGVGVALLLPNSPPRTVALIYGALMVMTLGLGTRFRMGVVAVAVLFVAGIGMRVAFFGVAYSDVLRVTSAAIHVVQAGGNPYGIGYDVTVPPGASFAYGPLALFWYLPFLSDPRFAEMLAGGAVLIALALRGRPLGLAVYALTPFIITTAGDGSNDTTAGLLLLIALVVAVRAPRAGGLLLAVAVAFKPYLAAWLPALWAWAGTGALLAFLAGFALTWGPVLLIWGLGNVLHSYALAEGIHANSYYSLASIVEAVIQKKQSAAGFGVVRLVLGVIATAVTVPWVRSASAMILSGTAIYAVTLYTGYWATHAYLAAIAPVLCWHLDEWVGFADQRVTLPGDPVGRLAAVVDRRWPLIEGRPRGGWPWHAWVDRPPGAAE